MKKWFFDDFSFPPPLPGWQFYIAITGGCAGADHRLISVSPPGENGKREDGSLGGIEDAGRVLTALTGLERVHPGLRVGRSTLGYSIARFQRLANFHFPAGGRMASGMMGIWVVLRTAKNGENAGNRLWGCSNFPRCRYILKVG